MPQPQWPELTLALALVVVLAFVIADLVARAVESSLRAILPDEHEARFVDRPKNVIRLVIFAITAAALAFPALRLAGYSTGVGGSPQELGRWLLDHGFEIAAISIGAYAVIRVGSAAARRFEQEMSAGTGLDVIERTKRAQTLGRLIQKTLSVVVIALAGLMILGELGVNITPVLTGAGIAGIAIGFGAQTLVKDIISGFFLILEDQVRVGDVAIVNGQGGLVEALNLRTIVLRDEEGTVHVVPNGEVKTLSNRSKDFSYYVISVGIPSDADPELVLAAIQDAGTRLLDDAAFRPHILEPLEMYGVDDFQGGQIVLKGRIKTVPLKQWTVGRELRRRIAATFKERGIELPVPQMNVRIEKLEQLLGGTRGSGSGTRDQGFKIRDSGSGIQD
jgi:moderate conductance mechanosensitive channel